MVAQHCECKESHGIVHFQVVKMVNFMLCDFLPQFKEKKTFLNLYNSKIVPETAWQAISSAASQSPVLF